MQLDSEKIQSIPRLVGLTVADDFSMEMLVKALHTAEETDDDITFMECHSELERRGLVGSDEYYKAYAREWVARHPKLNHQFLKNRVHEINNRVGRDIMRSRAGMRLLPKQPR